MRYELSYLNLLQGNKEEALNLLKDSNKDSAFIESMLLLEAEIYDYILNDKSKAVEIYLYFLENYPNSIYYDSIRIRLN